MRKGLGRAVGVSAVSLALIVGTYGCAGGARDGANRGGTPAPPGGGAAARQGAGANQGAGGAGGMQAGMLPGGANQTAQVDLGRQISDVVAQIDGLGGTDIAGAAGGPAGAAGGQAGGALPGSVGVSTLVVTNVAFVGIDTNTLARGAGNERGAAGGAAGTAVGLVGVPGGAGNPTGVADRVRAEVMASFPQIADVLVTTEPDLVSRIARVAGNVQNGVSMAGQMAEVAAITREMTLPNASDRDHLPGSR